VWDVGANLGRVKTSEWVTFAVAAVAAIATVGAAIAAAISARASSETARLLKAEHDAERVRRELEPLLELQGLLGEFLAQIVVSAEGDPTANQLQRRVKVVLGRGDISSLPLPKTTAFAQAEIGLVEQARRAFDEVNAVIHRVNPP
jgi:hypothetical protein